MSCTRNRVPARHTWPALRYISAPVAAALSISASASTMNGLLPPSSRLQGTRLARGRLRDPLGRGHGAGERHPGQPRVGHQPAPVFAPEPCTMLNTPGGRPAASAQSASSELVSGAHSGGLTMTGVARGQSRAELPGGQHQRRVPRRDDGHHAGRVVAHDVVRLLGVDRDGPAASSACSSEPGDVEHGARHHAVAHARQQHTGVACSRAGRRLGAPADLVGKALEHGQALGRGERAPRREGPLRGAERSIDIVGRALADAPEHGLVDRAAQLEVMACGHALAVDVVVRRHGRAGDLDEFRAHANLTLMEPSGP
jgi:hypothetical protein